MPASDPASILNQNRTDLGIPNRFNPKESDSSGAPGGAGVVGHATRTDVATRPRFGRGARHRTIRLREPSASGALRLPALHHHRGPPPRLSTAAA
jgi:hypothetical protein